jgi:hypothetical protein
MTNNKEIKIGDTVDCSGSILSNHSVVNGVVSEIRKIGYFVTGVWSDGQACGGVVTPDQITRHVPAAPVIARPAPPAIPEEVRKCLELALRELGSMDANAKNGPFSSMLIAARAWLASAPVATDKAVCPECGRNPFPSSSLQPGENKMKCFHCRTDYVIICHAFISPPRTEKGGAK